MNLDHVTLRTADLEGTRSFLERVLDLKPAIGLPFRFQAIGFTPAANQSCI